MKIISLFLLVASTFLLQSREASACIGPHTRMFPTCEVAAPKQDERVTVLYANGGEGLSSVALESTLDITEVVDVKIDPGDFAHYIAISSGKPLIWKFSGAIDAVSRVVVFGAQYSGADHAGIVGIPAEKIIYAKTDLDQLRSVQWDSCLSVYRACELSTYFKIPEADRMTLAGSGPEMRHHADQFVERLRGHTIRIPGDGWSEAEKRGRWKKSGSVTKMTGPAAGRYEVYAGLGYFQRHNYERGVIEIPKEDVVSLASVVPYDVFPGEIGLQRLVDQGVLVGPGSSGFENIYNQWNEAISAPFRSRFDPDFSFSYKIDYLITAPTRLPSGLKDRSFLVADGVDAPDMGSNDAFLTCLFFADDRDLPEVKRSRDDPRCDHALVTQAIPDEQRAFNRGKVWLQKLRESGEAAPEACLLTQLDDDVHLVAVVLSEGKRKRYLTQKSRRRIDVKIDRPGKVAIYLEMNGGRTDWHILPSPTTEVVSIFSRRSMDQSRNKVLGLETAVPVRSLNGAWNRDRKCLGYSPSFQAHLGGPAIMQLDESLNALVGKRIDAVVRETDDGSWPRNLDDPDAPRATFIVK